MLPEIIVDKPAGLPGFLVQRFVDEARRALETRGRFALALPGGSVATLFFPSLAAAPVDWSRVDFFWGDERAVPPDDPESNYGVATRLWLGPAQVPKRRIHRMSADAADIERAASAYSDEMTRLLGTPARLDLALLGMGPDGHVCSLFPGHALLREERLWVVALADSPKPPPRRLTLTLPALCAARLVVVAATGEAKAAVVREAIENQASALPVALATRGAGRSLFLLDEAAASRLARP